MNFPPPKDFVQDYPTDAFVVNGARMGIAVLGAGIMLAALLYALALRVWRVYFSNSSIFRRALAVGTTKKKKTQ